MPEQPPILVTGSHRSGTTWVGRMLALSPRLTYVHEPFNANSSHDLLPLSVDQWYRYLSPGAENNAYQDALGHVVGLRYPLLHRLQRVESLREAYRSVRSAAQYMWCRLMNRSVLWKDPLALLSAEWCAKQFDLEVLVMIRHPAAFAGSLKVKGWTFPFEDLLAQPKLVDDHFEDYVDDIEDFADHEHDVVDQAALLWMLLYSVVRTYQCEHPDWIYLRHEDVAWDPVATFESLYDTFGLDFTNSIRQEVAAHSRSSAGEDDLHRNSRAVIRNWTERLTVSEIGRVRRRTEPVASHFYSEDDW